MTNPGTRNPLLASALLFHRHGLWLSWPLLAFGLLATFWCIRTVSRLEENSRLGALPLVAKQAVEFDEAGPVELWLQGPHLSTRFTGLSFELIDPHGSHVRGRRSWFGRHSSGLSRARFAAQLYTLPQPGRYVLRTKGLGAPQPSDENHQVLFVRPHLAPALGCVVGMLLGAALAIGSLVNFLLRLRSA